MTGLQLTERGRTVAARLRAWEKEIARLRALADRAAQKVRDAEAIRAEILAELDAAIPRDPGGR